MSVKLTMYSADLSSELPLPFADQGVRAGFPSPAQDYMTDSIDLNRELIRHPATTFYARASGDSMRDCGIDDGDLLVIDKALEPQDGDIVVAFIDFWDPDILNRICSRIGVTGVFNRSEGQYIVSANVSSDSLEVYVDDETVTFKEISGEC